MRIVVLGTRGFPGVQGGVEAHCENLYPRLVSLGCEVTVFTRKPYVDPSVSENKGVKLIPLSCPKNKFLEAFIHTRKGIAAAKKLEPDILHIHAIGPALFAPLARRLGIKVVVTHHGPDYERKKWNWFARMVLKLGERRAVKYADELIAVSQVIADKIERKYGRKAKVIPNGITLPEIAKTDEALRKYGLERGKYILAVGRFVPEKGLDVLIGAWKRLRVEGWKLVIAGDADHPDKYSERVKKAAKENPDIVLTGFLSGQPLAELYSHAGLFVLPSYYEGLPIVLLEAMSYGLSCVVSDIPANREVGLAEDRFFEVGNSEALAAKIKEFAAKPLSEEEKRQLRESVAKKYDWQDIAAKTLHVNQTIHP
jgi:glycosyltransferase involved in cell wall biosynthesis